jgi:uncharacterized protein (TIGR04222 family)
MILNPLALDAPAFLWLYGLLLVASFGLSRYAAYRLRPDGSRHPVSDPDSLALLTGGPVRLAEAAIARLMANGVLAHASGQRFIKTGRGNATLASPVDRAMVALPAPARWRDLWRAAKREADALRAALERQGLLMDAEAATQLRIVQILPFVALLMLGTARLVRGIMLDHAVGYLIVLMLITLVFGLSRLTVDRRTRAGQQAVRSARVDWQRLRLAPTQPEMALAVAVFGTAVLAGSALEPLHRLRNNSGGDGGSADSSGCGSGGCGGGGCGG